MAEDYLPPSDFLKSVIGDEVPLSGGPVGAANLARLAAMTRDPDRANRDWAALLLGQQDVDTAEIREALLGAAKDEDDVVRAEAILALAQRDPDLALPILRNALAGDRACAALFEAAILIADQSLADDLRAFAQPSDNAFLDRLAAEALAACERGS